MFTQVFIVGFLGLVIRPQGNVDLPRSSTPGAFNLKEDTR